MGNAFTPLDWKGSAGSMSGLRSRVTRASRRLLPPSLVALVDDGDWTIGIGPTIGGGMLVGGGVSGGLLVDRGGFGYYGTVGLVAGVLANLSAGLHLVVKTGGAEAFFGRSHAVAVSVAPAFSGVTLLYEPGLHRRLVGVSFEWSLGGRSLPIEVYVGVLKTRGHAWTWRRLSRPQRKRGPFFT